MPDFLPETYEFSHTYCLFLHDLMAEMIRYGEEGKLFDQDFHFRDLNDAEEFKKRNGIEILKWLKENGYEYEVKQLFIKQLFPAIVSDVCHFIFESLSCSRKGKLTVAYNLLRKPLKENLFYLEWLLVDLDDFYNRFHSSDMDNIELNKSKVEKKNIISKALGSVKYKNWISSDFLYSIRYDKKFDYGLELLWQKATHLITSHPSYKTEEANLNFIFSDANSRESQWLFYYFLVPLLLFHMYSICSALYEKIIIVDENVKFSNDLRSVIGFMLHNRNDSINSNIEEYDKKVFAGFTDMKFKCEKCEGDVNLTLDNLKSLFYDFSITCNNCGFIKQISH